MNRKIGLCLVAIAFNGAACRTLVNTSQTKADRQGAASSSASDGTVKNARLKEFYAENKVIEVVIKTKDWDSIRYADPKGGLCNFSYAGPQYDWYEVEEIKIDGKVFAHAGIKKKSWCGSESKFKPSLSVNLSKYNSDNKDLAAEALGTDSLILNNSIQDESFVRQCFAYKQFAKAGIPAPLCNFARVTVNGYFQGVYVNLQPLKKAFFKEKFGSDEGNLYEIAGEWLDNSSDARYRADMESFKKPEDTSLDDLHLLIRAVGDGGSAGQAKELIDVPAFMKFWAAEVLLSHYDGLTLGNNNASLFFPVKGKMQPIPWGTDRILTLSSNREVENIYSENFLASKLKGDAASMVEFHAALQSLLTSVWKEEALLAEIDQAAAAVRNFVPHENNQQIRFNDGINLLKNNLKARRSQLSRVSSPGQTLQNGKDGRFCLNTQNINGQAITNIYGCGTHQDQKWELIDMGGGYSHIRNPASNNCLNLRDSNEWTETDTSPCGNHQDQSWKINSVDGMKQFESARAPGLCLSINEAQDGRRTPVRACNGGDRAQLWK
jgi:spore coat protein CotH